MSPSSCAILLLLSFWMTTGFAHSVQHRIDSGPAAVITLTYGNGKPYAHEKYSLHADGASEAQLTGHTDSAGRIVFLPGATEQWQLKAQAPHGHGVAFDFKIPRPEPPPAPHRANQSSVTAPAASQPVDGRPNNSSLALFGFSLILGGFGAYQLFAGRRRV